MRTVLTGLYRQTRARFDVVTLLAGMWTPQPLGIVQIYGVVGLGETLDAAREWPVWAAKRSSAPWPASPRRSSNR